MTSNVAAYQYLQDFRSIEKITKKCVKIKGAIKYNQTCLNNGIFPLHVKIKLRGQAVTNNENVQEIQKDELRKEISQKIQELQNTELDLKNKLEELKTTVSDEL